MHNNKKVKFNLVNRGFVLSSFKLISARPITSSISAAIYVLIIILGVLIGCAYIGCGTEIYRCHCSLSRLLIPHWPSQSHPLWRPELQFTGRRGSARTETYRLRGRLLHR